MSKPLLTTKLHVPSVRSALVHHTRLLQRLDRGVDRKLTLVSAPAGYGKTTLLKDWIDHTRVPTAWLSLDDADNDVFRFLTYLIAALQQIIRAISERAREYHTEKLVSMLHLEAEFEENGRIKDRARIVDVELGPV